MNKLQPSPLFSTRATPLRQSVAAWGVPPRSVDETKFFRSWLVYDSDFELTRTQGRVNWNLVSGVALMTLVSAAGWASIAWLVAHFWK